MIFIEEWPEKRPVLVRNIRIFGMEFADNHLQKGSDFWNIVFIC